MAYPEWQPIETAPTDSKWFLAFGSGSGFAECSFICRWSLVLGYWTQAYDPYDRKAFPIRWMPLPDPPADTGR
jgi:hypothetical protein